MPLSTRSRVLLCTRTFHPMTDSADHLPKALAPRLPDSFNLQISVAFHRYGATASRTSCTFRTQNNLWSALCADPAHPLTSPAGSSSKGDAFRLRHALDLPVTETIPHDDRTAAPRAGASRTHDDPTSGSHSRRLLCRSSLYFFVGRSFHRISPSCSAVCAKRLSAAT